MSRAKPSHHEIPQFYLKGFCDSNTSFLWVFERNKPFNPGPKRGKNNPARVSISKVGLRSDGYVIPTTVGKPDYSYENKLQKEEHKADIPLSKVRNQDKITAADKEIIARYIGLMGKRLMKRDQIATKMLDSFFNSFQWDGLQRELAFRGQFGKALQVPVARKLLHSEQGKTKILRESMLTPYKMTHEVLLKMTWSFLVAPNGEYFITSDNPVIFDEPLGLLKSPLIFPINQRIILFSQWPQTNDLSYKNISMEETSKFNTVIIRYTIKEIYSPKPDKWIHELLGLGAVLQ
jgi:hypothetical protein